MQAIEKFEFNENSNVKNVIAVVSGKGGVGKTFTTSVLASHLRRQGYKVGVLDADITGPSIPKGFGIDELARSNGREILPLVSKTGIEIISVNSILENKTTPVLWRAPIINNAINQFFSQVRWGNLDYLLIDMPPGTGDVSLTVFQSMPLSGVIIVSTPSDLVTMIVEKAVTMAKMMSIKILGFIENMSTFKCPNCGEVHEIFGPSHIEEIAKRENVKNICKLPIDETFSQYVDKGNVEFLEIPQVDKFIEDLKNGL
ncbi:Mrp/NBP35 family ATP-binding protein [Peptoniphilus lacrimalis]|uniref:Iron-sulfur cluster carrier protein n=1 Tax=Peptoniphilus lacrimalis 315-B TaxID=596330 RepID=D1VU45_9FIRM|nr:Mrp/NBP35 family ATP-binding protein [Peptoniphilus lacrimalis]EFA89920.1 nucleotide-binding protein [Peptoniphilus lacrimalis 315-B]